MIQTIKINGDFIIEKFFEKDTLAIILKKKNSKIKVDEPSAQELLNGL